MLATRDGMATNRSGEEVLWATLGLRQIPTEEDGAKKTALARLNESAKASSIEIIK
jgi:hypothetical protein